MPSFYSLDALGLAKIDIRSHLVHKGLQQLVTIICTGSKQIMVDIQILLQQFGHSIFALLVHEGNALASKGEAFAGTIEGDAPDLFGRCQAPLAGWGSPDMDVKAVVFYWCSMVFGFCRLGRQMDDDFATDNRAQDLVDQGDTLGLWWWRAVGLDRYRGAGHLHKLFYFRRTYR